MNKKIFIEFDNSTLKKLSEEIRNYFINNNYTVTLLDNTISLDEKKRILNANNNYFLLSNKLSSNSNSIEIIYPLNSNDNLAKSIFTFLDGKYNVTKYYQLRSFTNTKDNYYEILGYNNDSIIIRYGSDLINNSNLAKDIFLAINNYLNQENIYIVKSGDSLYKIAKNYNTSVDELKRINNLTSNLLSIGQKLIIPTSNNQDNIYIVKSGDSLYKIAKNYNTSVDELKRINNLTSNLLSIGQKLIIK